MPSVRLAVTLPIAALATACGRTSLDLVTGPAGSEGAPLDASFGDGNDRGATDLATEGDAADGAPRQDAGATEASLLDRSGPPPCTDLSDDPHNCGLCGHDCQGGACEAGACQPLALYQGPVGDNNVFSAPWGLALDVDNVYWTDNQAGTVMKTSKLGGAATQLTTTPKPLELAIDSTSLYWTSQGGPVVAMALAGGGLTTLASFSAGTYGIAVDPEWVYFTTTAPFDGEVVKVAHDGSGQAVLASGEGNPVAVATTGSAIYWANQQPSFNAMTQQQGDIIGTVPIDGGATITIASGQYGATNLALDSDFVYWDISGVALYKASLDGGTAENLGRSCGGSVAVDATGVYCAGSGVITRMPLGGGEATTVASYSQYTMGLATFSRDIALDATSVYWTVPYYGLVLKVAK